MNTPATPPHGPRAPQTAEPQSGVMLRVTHASGKRRQVHARNVRTTFGTHSDCTVQLSDSDVLPVHATLVQLGGQAVLHAHDLPLVINGSETHEALLTTGDRFQLGNYTVEVLQVEPSGSASTAATNPAVPPAFPQQPENVPRRLSFARSFRPVSRRSFRRDTSHGARRPIGELTPSGSTDSPEHAELFSRFDSLTEKLGEVASAFDSERARARDAEQLEEARQKQEQLERRVDELKQKAAALQAVVDESQQVARAEKQHGLQLEGELQKTRQLLESIQAEQEGQKLSWENETAGMQLHLQTMSSELAQTQAQCTGLEKQRDESQRRADQIEADARRLRLQLKRTSTELDAVTKRENDVQQKRESLEHELATTRDQLAKVEKARDAAHRDLQQQAAQLADSVAQQQRLEQRAADTARDLEQATAQLGHAQAEIAALAGRLEQASTQSASLREERQKAEQRWKAEVEKQSERLAAVTAERDAAQERCRSADDEHAETRSQIQKLQAEIDRLNGQLTADSEQLAEATRLQQQSESAREELQAQLEQTREELDERQSALCEVQQQLAAANEELSGLRTRLQETVEREAAAVRDLEATKDQLADACEKIESLSNSGTVDLDASSDGPVVDEEPAVNDQQLADEQPFDREEQVEDPWSTPDPPEAHHDSLQSDAEDSQGIDDAPHGQHADSDFSEPPAAFGDSDAPVENLDAPYDSWPAAEDEVGSDEISRTQCFAPGEFAAPPSDSDLPGERAFDEPPRLSNELKYESSNQWGVVEESDEGAPHVHDEAGRIDDAGSAELPAWYSSESDSSGAIQHDAVADDAWAGEAWTARDESDEAAAVDAAFDSDAEPEPRFESSEEVMARLRRMVGGSTDELDPQNEPRDAAVDHAELAEAELDGFAPENAHLTETEAAPQTAGLAEIDGADPYAADDPPDDADEPAGFDTTEPVEANPGRAQASDSDDESIESYMQRLLARVQGRGDEEEPASAPIVKNVQPTKATGGSAAVSASGDAVEEENEISFVPRSAPEKTRDLAAMRELANTSARSAIRSSVRRRRWAAAGSKLAISVVALATSCGLTIFSGFKFGFLVVLAGCFLTVSIVWGADAMLTLQRMGRDTAEKEK